LIDKFFCGVENKNSICENNKKAGIKLKKDSGIFVKRMFAIYPKAVSSFLCVYPYFP